MSVDFHSQFGNTPKDGDFARYVENLVNRGLPAPGTPGYLSPDKLASPPGGPTSGPDTHPAANVRGGATSRGPAQPQAPGQPLSQSQATPSQAQAGTWSTTTGRYVAPPGGLRRGLARLLLPLALVWLALGLGLDIPFFANSLPIGMVMLFASFYLHSPKRQQ